MGLCWNKNERCPSTSSSVKTARRGSSGSRSSRIRIPTCAPPAAKVQSGGCSRPPRSSSRDRVSTSPTTRRSPRPMPVPARSRAARSRASDSKSGDGGSSATSSSSSTTPESTSTPSRQRFELQRQEKLAARRDRGVEAEAAQVVAEGLREVRPAQREIHHGLEEPQLVAGVVAHAVDLAAVDRPLLQQPPQPVGQLDLAGAVLLLRGLLQRREDVGREDVAADDREVRRRLRRAAASRPDRGCGRRPGGSPRRR